MAKGSLKLGLSGEFSPNLVTLLAPKSIRRVLYRQSDKTLNDRNLQPERLRLGIILATSVDIKDIFTQNFLNGVGT